MKGLDRRGGARAFSGSSRLRLTIEIERFFYRNPIKIAGYTIVDDPVVKVSLFDGTHTGHGEASGVYYHDDTPESLAQVIECVRADIELGIDRAALQSLLPPGGARNALDCALWDLESQQERLPAWRLAGLAQTQPLGTAMTVGIDTPQAMAAAARAFGQARAIKAKLDGAALDRDRILAIRQALPGAQLTVDANQGWTLEHLRGLMPTMVEAGVSLIEQPLPRDQEEALAGFDSPIPMAADESFQSLADLGRVARLYHCVNIKLDKCGGLTEAIAIARLAGRYGLSVIVGCMGGSSLATAPAFVVAQLAQFVDLDSPLLLRQDREPAVQYRNGLLDANLAAWGNGGCGGPVL